MIKFKLEQDGIVLIYEEEFRSTGWIERELANHEEVTVGKVFTFTPSDQLDAPEDEFLVGADGFRFRVATTDGEYYRVPGRVLDIEQDVFIVRTGLKINRKLFAAERDISIFRRIAEVVGSDAEIVIGGSRTDAIPVQSFEELLRKFPKTTEMKLYAQARVASIVGEFFDGMADHRARYEAYLNKRATLTTADFPRMDAVLQAEIAKYVLVRDTIVDWLANETVRPEKDWQTMILEFILLIFPKYVAVLQNVHVEDRYARPDKPTPRYLDIALVDGNGHIDLIEIKRPFDDLVLTRKKYRGNYVPTHELSGTIMQAEKYLFHLSKWGVDGEKKLQMKHGSGPPTGMQLRITNPRAIVILGRDRRPDGSGALEPAQLFDLELIKRKYAKMMDIITYDDLLRRLNNLILSLQRRLAGDHSGVVPRSPEADGESGGDDVALEEVGRVSAELQGLA